MAIIVRVAKQKSSLTSVDLRLIAFFNRTFIPLSRFSIFLIFFWFGLIKLLGLSPAGPLARALVEKTVGIEYFDALFYTLAFIEILIGLLFLFPKATRIVVPLLLLHILIICSPLVFLPEQTWQRFAVPTLEGQYIIKNALVVAVAIGIASKTKPLQKSFFKH